MGDKRIGDGGGDDMFWRRDDSGKSVDTTLLVGKFYLGRVGDKQGWI